MPATLYNYSISSDTANAKASVDSLRSEIEESAITIAIETITTSGDDLDITMKDALSGAEQTTLYGVVSAHQGEPLPENEILVVQPRPSVNEVSLRIHGDYWNCPANTSTTHYFPLNDDYEVRGAEFQFVNGKAGDYVEVWVTDKDGVLYPAGTRLTKYIEKFCVYEHEPGTQAWVADLVDDDTSDLVPSVFYFEFVYTNNQPALSDDVKAIVNFWMYKRV